MASIVKPLYLPHTWPILAPLSTLGDGGTPHGQRLSGRPWSVLAEQVPNIPQKKNPTPFLQSIFRKIMPLLLSLTRRTACAFARRPELTSPTRPSRTLRAASGGAFGILDWLAQARWSHCVAGTKGRSAGGRTKGQAAAKILTSGLRGSTPQAASASIARLRFSGSGVSSS